MRVRVQKKAEVTGGLPARDMADHIPGKEQPDGFSIPIDYTVEGETSALPKVGESFFMLRDTRNGIKATGMFQTSPVTEVTSNSFRTRNSIYNYLVLTSLPETV